MRSILLENDILDGWAYWGYGLNHLRWAISTIARRLNRSCTQTHPLRIAGEVHYNSDLRWLREGLLRELGSDAPIRPLATRCECKIALVTRLREPHPPARGRVWSCARARNRPRRASNRA